MQNASKAALRAMLEAHTPDYCIGAAGGIIREYPVTTLTFQVARVDAGFGYYKDCLRQLLAPQRRERTR